ncbi:hypothetical protein KP509_22G065400 [Ceratopteris richardii]|uniref:Protein ENHANCED DISEASE RESISTANCE 2 C-terminal domain-containing protein n=1 Tax=Ceratopteris richardii TaxID=49495 RepID=A0A8T2S5Z9_CERRI|nr:hypothetical protein KP509_22G065400 [Ceratopteris richardii]
MILLIASDFLPWVGNNLDQSRSMHQIFPSSEGTNQRAYLDASVFDQKLDVLSASDKKLSTNIMSHNAIHDEIHKADNGGHQDTMDRDDQHTETSFHSSCLPRLRHSVSFNDKKAPVSPGLQKTKNSLLHFSFKRRSNDFIDGANPFISNVRVERPVAGFQIPFSAGDKFIEGTWSLVGPSTFKLRGSSYLRDKIKVFASQYQMYEPFGVDVFLSPKKVSHVARFVELPDCEKTGDLPALLILNIQIPMYPTSIFLNEVDGEGLSLVLYHKLSDQRTEVPSYFQKMFVKILCDEAERVRGLAGDSMVPYRERLKILGRVINPEELHLSVAERKIVYTYNEKPVLSRPQHTFYKGESYFEVDLDMHRFSYLARKGVESFRERLKLCVLDLGLTIQGNKPDELPEHVLCCVRINKIDFTSCKQLVVDEGDMIEDSIGS